jgi:hypothetical protein
MNFKQLLFPFSLMIALAGRAQDEDLLKSLGTDSVKKEKVTGGFKSTRVIMSHSMEMLRPGVLDFRILHRFGNVNRGISEFFGMDQATMRLGLDYGICNDLTVGIGRGTYKKELDGYLKYRVLQQSTGPKSSPVSLIPVGGMTVSTSPWSNPSRENFFSSRLAYYAQLIIGRKFSDAFTLQLTPTFLHRNLTATPNDPNDLYATGIGGRVRLSRRVSLNIDYYYVFNKNDQLPLYNPLSIGFDIETGGHVFQLHFTNAIGMNERAFLSETTNDWAQGDIQFGFNISRTFQIKKSKS